jgi:hypothetical protein
MLHRVIVAIVCCCWAGPALGAETVLACRHKTFPNLPGENSVVLVRIAPKKYALTVRSYDKPKRFKGLKCTFHEKDAGTFYCADSGDRRGFFSNRTRELSVTTDGKPQAFEGYTFQAVDAPLGQSRQFVELRFASAQCKVGGK